jgi:hypothetical protein
MFPLHTITVLFYVQTVKDKYEHTKIIANSKWDVSDAQVTTWETNATKKRKI